MTLALQPPLEPQLARSGAALPRGDGWCYEPKYDGFRAIVFVEGERWRIQSRGGRPLARYFPELSFPPGCYVLDGEIVIDADADAGAEANAGGGGARQDFEALQNRIHPAASRIALLAERTPARYIAFDLLARGERSLLAAPLSERRAALERLAGEVGGALALTPQTENPAEAEPWLAEGEGVVAKQRAAPYRPGQRAGMVKVKRLRTIDAVVAGYRPGKEPGTVGSLILGLYDERGQLRVVGHSSALRAAEKRALAERLAGYETGERGRGEPSRWKSEKELEWIAIAPELVVEVSFDHVSGGRIRHGTKILRWRQDKRPRECSLAQLCG